MERDTEREVRTLSDRVKLGSEDILRKMDRQETSTEDIKRIVMEGLMSMSDIVEKEMTGVSEIMAVRWSMDVE